MCLFFFFFFFFFENKYTARPFTWGGKKKNVSFVAKVYESRRATLRVLSRSSLGQHERVFLSFFERKNERKISLFFFFESKRLIP